MVQPVAKEAAPHAAGTFVEERAAGADRERGILAAETGEACGFELLEKPALARIDVEVPGRKPSDEEAGQVEAVRRENFRGRDAPHLVAERLRRDFGNAKRAAREREPGNSHRRLVAADRKKDVFGFFLEERRFGE